MHFKGHATIDDERDNNSSIQVVCQVLVYSETDKYRDAVTSCHMLSSLHVRL